ncbi:MAG: PEP-utilizing enzyme [Thiotrichales bacterium]|nr:PEP-utilizing enzyme [Thiotrichales bacterium]
MITHPFQQKPLKHWSQASAPCRPVQRILQGRVISPGFGAGRPCFYNEHQVARIAADTDSVPEELSLFEDACRRCHEHLDRIISTARDQHHEEVEIFVAYKMILDEIQSDIAANIRQYELPARNAVRQYIQEYIDYFRNLENNYVSDRVVDLEELGKLLLGLLNNMTISLGCRDYDGCQVGTCALGNPHILVAEELTANVAIRMRSPTQGIVVEKCGVNSHAAIIARSLKIPVVSGIRISDANISCEDDLLIDGERGKVIINPDEETRRNYIDKSGQSNRSIAVVEPVNGFRVLANLDLAGQLSGAIQAGAEGIGLYRTELELLSGEELPDEQALYETCRTILQAMPDKPVAIRLPDLGSDKSAPWLDLDAEDNPALGCRGARLLLKHPEILRLHARALARASRHGPINVIYPMISTVQQFTQLKQRFLESINNIEDTHLRHGIMFEVPSACECVEEFFSIMDFGKVGSSDLIQYLYAYDRVRDDFDAGELAGDPAIWKILRRLVNAAESAGKAIDICGALADNPEFIPRLMDLGVSSVSTHYENVAAVRQAAAQYLNVKSRESTG